MSAFSVRDHSPVAMLAGEMRIPEQDRSSLSVYSVMIGKHRGQRGNGFERMNFFTAVSVCRDTWAKVTPRLRGRGMYLLTGIRFKRVGVHTKIRGVSSMHIGRHVALGDFCWIEAVERYGENRYTPALSIGDDVSISDLSHISCVHRITIGAGCLLGSKIYIGDHNHGSLRDYPDMRHLPPAKRPLGDAAEIAIGEHVWIGDGAVILGGTQIASGSIVGANSVAKLSVDRPALIAGVPAKVIRYLDEDQPGT